MFADDTTLYIGSDNIDSLISKFKLCLSPMIEWCKFNKLDINWSKTYFMFITNKRIKNKIPNDIVIDGSTVKVVTSFKLLGVTIDNKLVFDQYSRDIRTLINQKLYSIKRLFYLCTSVKIQFFKTFIMPYFDYCLSLLIYFPKSTIQGLSDCFNFCLFKLFKFKIESESVELINSNDINNFNLKLQKFGLFSFQHRLMNKLLSFLNNIISCDQAPSNLKSQIVQSESTKPNTKSTRRNVYNEAITEKFGQLTFDYFFSKLKSNLHTNDFKNTFSSFKNLIMSNMYTNFPIFINLFARFNVEYRIYSLKAKHLKKKQSINIRIELYINKKNKTIKNNHINPFLILFFFYIYKIKLYLINEFVWHKRS